MNWQHFQAILWLRWRISLNQLKRGGIASTIVLALLAIVVLTAAIVMFFVALLVGILALPKATPDVLMLLWDAIVVGFLMFWMIGLLTELQRAEILSLQKLLHLPVSLAGTFIINYLGSLLSVSLVVFLPAMIGLSIALLVVKGVVMLTVFPLLASFLLMVTALTYQFQGWLAALMSNQRKRRTVIVVVTMCFVLVFQLPNVLNLMFQNRRNPKDELAAKQEWDLAQLERLRASGELSEQEFIRQRDALNAEHKAQFEQASRARQQSIRRVIVQINILVPLGWLPYGVMASAEGRVLPALLGTVGASLIGAGSLWRSYRTMYQLYTGQFSARPQRRASKSARTAVPDTRFMERHIPALSEQASAVAMASLRSLTRAPEAKMLLLTPAIMIVVFGSMLLTRSVTPPDIARPFMGFGAITMILLTVMQIVGNQFGLDRDGFRVLVLSSATRRDILLGKNVAVAPLVLALGTIAVALLQALYPMRISHFMATLAELVSLYMVSSLVGNFTSILAPMPVAAGSLKPAHPKAKAVLLHLLFFFMFPMIFGLALIPLGVELLLHHFGWLRGVPIYFMGAVFQLLVVAIAYRMLIEWQGKLLHAREQRILTVVTSKVE